VPCGTNCRLVLGISESHAIKLQKIMMEFREEGQGGDTMKVTVSDGFHSSTMVR
jgi:hypothetical protein